MSDNINMRMCRLGVLKRVEVARSRDSEILYEGYYLAGVVVDPINKYVVIL